MTTIHNTARAVNPNSYSHSHSHKAARCALRTRASIDPNLPHGAVRVFLRLDDRAGMSGWAYPFQETIAAEIRASVRSVQTWVRVLVDTGYVSIRRTVRGNRYRMGWAGQEQEPGQETGQETLPFPAPVSVPVSVVVPTENCGSNPQPVADASINEPDPEPEDRSRAQTDKQTGTGTVPPEAVRILLPILEMFASLPHTQIRDRHGDTWTPTPTDRVVLPALMRVAGRNGVSVYQLGAYLYNRYNYIRSHPRLSPQSPYWFAAVVDNHFSCETRTETPTKGSQWATASARAIGQGQEGVADPGFSAGLLQAAMAGVGRIA